MKTVYTSENGYKRLLDGKQCFAWELTDRTKTISKIKLTVHDGVNLKFPITMKDLIE